MKVVVFSPRSLLEESARTALEAIFRAVVASDPVRELVLACEPESFDRAIETVDAARRGHKTTRVIQVPATPLGDRVATLFEELRLDHRARSLLCAWPRGSGADARTIAALLADFEPPADVDAARLQPEGSDALWLSSRAVEATLRELRRGAQFGDVASWLQTLAATPGLAIRDVAPG